MDQVLVEVTRAGVVESQHRGTAVLMGASGEVIQAWGDPTRLIFPRSSMKPFQSLVMAETGLTLSSEQWALSGASHEGESMHVTRVENWLAEMALTEANLVCGPAWPSHGKSRKAMVLAGGAARRAVHNCSGKHCGHLATCQHEGWDVDGYDDPSHPIQKRVLNRISELCDQAPDVVGVDGCSLPAPRLSLLGFARGLAALAGLADDGERPATTILSAAMKHPELTGGSTAMNGRLTKAGDGMLYAKNGAEGVYSVIFPKVRAALALKVTDGTQRAADTAAAGLIAQAGALLSMDLSAVGALSATGLRNADGLDVGEIRFAPG